MDPLRADQTPSPPQAPFDPTSSNLAPPDTTVFEAQAASASASREARNRAPTGDAPLPPSRPRNPSTGVAENPGPSPLRRREERALLPRQAPGYAPFQSEGREPGMAPQARAQPFNTAARRRGPDAEWASLPRYRPFNPGEPLASLSEPAGDGPSRPGGHAAEAAPRAQATGLHARGNPNQAVNPAVLRISGTRRFQAWVRNRVKSLFTNASKDISPPVTQPADPSPAQAASHYAAIINANLRRHVPITTSFGAGQNFIDFGQLHIGHGFGSMDTNAQTSYILRAMRGLAETSRYPAARIGLNRILNGPSQPVVIAPQPVAPGSIPTENGTINYAQTGLTLIALSLTDGPTPTEQSMIQTGGQPTPYWAAPHGTPYWITMMHEINHAADYRSGTGYPVNQQIVANGISLNINELAVIGLGPFRNAEGTENAIRAQAGLPRRNFVNDIRELGPDGFYGSRDDYWNRPGYDFSQLPPRQ